MDVSVRKLPEISSFGDILPDKLVCVLDGSLLPGGVGVGEIHCGLEILCDALVPHELAAVVGGDGQDVPPVRREEPDGGLRDPLRVLPVRQPLHHHVVPAPLAQGQDRTLLASPHDQVHLPVAESPPVSLRGPGVDAHAVGDVPHPRLASDGHVVPVLEPVAAVPPQFPGPVRPYPRIDALVRDADPPQEQVSGNLPGRPVLLPEQPERHPHGSVLHGAVPGKVPLPVARPLVRSRPAVFPQTVPVPADFAADGRFVHLKLPGNGAAALSLLQTQVDCVSLLPGQLMIFHTTQS